MYMVSIIVPIYNVEKYVKQCVDSILNQTYREIELILVDDGSPDGCASICDSFERMDKRVKTIHKKNGGLASARNAGLEIATGEYICFIDGDDWVDENYINQLICSIGNNGKTLVVAEMSIDFLNDGFSQMIKLDSNKSRVPIKKGFAEMMKTESFNYSCNKLYNRSVIEQGSFRFEEGSEPAEDFIFNSKYVRMISQVSFATGAPYHYIRRDGNTMTNKYISDLYNKSKRTNDILRSLYLEFGQNEEEIANCYLETYIYRMFSCIPNLYRKETKETRKEKREIYQDMKSNQELRKCLLEFHTDDVHLKAFRWMILNGSTYLIDFVYSILFVIRNKFTWIYIFFRKRIRKIRAGVV